jgi:hypothetical protein
MLRGAVLAGLHSHSFWQAAWSFSFGLQEVAWLHRSITLKCVFWMCPSDQQLNVLLSRQA